MLCALGMVMSFGHGSLLMIPRSQPRRSLSSSSSSSSSSSFSSSSSSRGAAAPTAAPTDAAMDVEEAAAAGRGAAAARSFLLQLSDLRGNEKVEAFEFIRDGLKVHERFKLR